jgi:hypothetical protein
MISSGHFSQFNGPDGNLSVRKSCDKGSVSLGTFSSACIHIYWLWVLAWWWTEIVRWRTFASLAMSFHLHWYVQISATMSHHWNWATQMEWRDFLPENVIWSTVVKASITFTTKYCSPVKHVLSFNPVSFTFAWKFVELMVFVAQLFRTIIVCPSSTIESYTAPVQIAYDEWSRFCANLRVPMACGFVIVKMKLRWLESVF